MKTFLKSFASLAVALFVLAGYSPAQTLCSDWMTPSYSTYVTYSFDDSPALDTAHFSVTVDGQTTGTPPSGCSATGIQHQPKAYNYIVRPANGVSQGGWLYGTSLAWNQYLTVTNNQAKSMAVGTTGATYNFTAEGIVICTFKGVLYDDPRPTGMFGTSVYKTATTGYGGITAGARGDAALCYQAPWCSDASTPGAFQTNLLDYTQLSACSPYYTCSADWLNVPYLVNRLVYYNRHCTGTTNGALGFCSHP